MFNVTNVKWIPRDSLQSHKKWNWNIRMWYTYNESKKLGWLCYYLFTVNPFQISKIWRGRHLVSFYLVSRHFERFFIRFWHAPSQWETVPLTARRSTGRWKLCNAQSGGWRVMRLWVWVSVGEARVGVCGRRQPCDRAGSFRGGGGKPRGVPGKASIAKKKSNHFFLMA